MGDESKVRERAWNLQVRMPRSVLAAATFVAFMSGVADEPAQAQDTGPKSADTHRPHSTAAAHHHIARHHPGHHLPAPPHPAYLHPVHLVAPHGNAMHPTGLASWYDRRQRGQITASGDLFDPDRLTAAHRSLPLGTRIRVTRTGSSQSVIVVVNDRGPYVRGRVLDLSPAAAQALGARVGEIMPVTIEVVSLPQRLERTARR
jgi:rare lipoprotein A (peptidoglycan hydrolase)